MYALTVTTSDTCSGLKVVIIPFWSLHPIVPTPLAVQVKVTVVGGQTDMIPSSDDGEEDREKPWTPTRKLFS